jgi:L-threonylcarbamoyladenylate synthase
MGQIRILSTHTRRLFEQAVEAAARELARGEIVALPTETVYGLAANALDATAVSKVYEVKGRPEHNPIIVHVDSLAMAQYCAGAWPTIAERLARAFWPGPLTVVVPRAAAVPDVVTAGGATVGIRWPSHPFMQAVIRKCGFPLAAPSANLSNQLSPTNAEHVRTQLGSRIGLIVDGGQSQVGIESSVVDAVSDPPCVLRPGMIHDEALLAVTRQLTHASDEAGTVLQSPGQLPKHYAPKAKLVLLSWADETELREQVRRRSLSPAGLHVIAHTQIPSGEGLAGVSVIPHDPEAFARALYAELHRCDAEGAATIVVEAVPPGAAWRGIADRLKRAATSAA